MNYRNGNYAAEIPLDEFAVHPKYDGHWSKGYDYALAPIPDEFQAIVNSFYNSRNFIYTAHSDYLKLIKKGDKVQVCSQ